MKRHNITILILALLSPLMMTSCSENDDTVEEFPDWKDRNEAYFNEIYERARNNADGSWKLFLNYSLQDTIPTSNDDYIAVQVIEEGTGSGCPMYTDSVLVNYRGRLIPSTSYADGYVFDQSYEGEYNPATAMPAQFYVGGVIDGLTTALMQMHIGDVWRVYIPYNLGYGETGSSSIPGYSTLIFDIALIAYYRAGVSPGTWLSAAGGWITE